MLVYMYIHIHRWTNTILSQNIFFSALLAQKVILAKKMGTTATAGGVSCYVQCNIPTWTVRKDMRTHEKVAMDNPLYVESFFRHEPFYKAWTLSHDMLVPTNWMTFCTHKKVTRGNPFYVEKFILCRKISLCRKCFMQKISFTQKIFFVQKNSFYAEKFLYAENFLCRKFSLCREISLCRKVPFMQKRFPLCRKIPFMQKNFFWAWTFYKS